MSTNTPTSPWMRLSDYLREYHVRAAIADITIDEESFLAEGLGFVRYLKASVSYTYPWSSRGSIYTITFLANAKAGEEESTLLESHPEDLWVRDIKSRFSEDGELHLFKAAFIRKGEKLVKINLTGEWIPHLKISAELEKKANERMQAEIQSAFEKQQENEYYLWSDPNMM